MNELDAVSSDDAPLGERIAGNAIRFERTLPAPIERVWEALTTPAGLAPWLGEAAIDLRAGGHFRLDFGESEMRGRILTLEPPTRLVLFWQEFDVAGPIAEHGVTPDFHSELSFELRALANGTKLTLVHRLIAGGDVMASFLGGWHAHLAALRATLGKSPSPDRGALYELIKPRYDALFSALALAPARLAEGIRE